MAGLLVQNKFSPFLREILQLFGLSCCIVFLLLISSLGSDQQYRSDVVRNKDQDVGSHCPSESWAVSTCGCQGDRRGHHQKVIALSFDGNLSDQLTQDYAGQLGFVDQILSANYPNDGWILRIYTRNVERLQKANLFIGSDAGRQRLVDICDVKMVLNEEIRPHLLGAGDIPPNHWRFLPLLDPMVDLVISWDSSRPLTDREVGAVQEWLTTSADTSYRTIIKDFDSHYNKMVSGVWVAKQQQTTGTRLELANFATRLFQTPSIEKLSVGGLDQEPNLRWPVALLNRMRI